ncbi:MAG TPA: hypothetical protein PLZ37_01165 [Nitrospira sp.]|nr:hypothetical protein [Nitrospira sp.]
MIITLDIFSGRSNPSWLLSQKDINRLLERFSGRALTEAEAVDGVLGFRGLVVSSTSDEQLPGGMPANFRVGGLLPVDYVAPESASRALTADESDEAVKWLLSTGQHAIGEDVLSHLEDTLEMRKRSLEIEAPSESATEEKIWEEEGKLVAKAVCIIQNTPYNPAFWNAAGVIGKNNCYNYAMNYRSDTFAQPGRISGHPNNTMACTNVATAANWDGCKATCSGSNKNVALVIWPGQDYHWYRKHSNGFWGHKPGGTAARNTDSLNRVINGATLTPQNCARGPYTIFCGYRYSPTGMKVR